VARVRARTPAKGKAKESKPEGKASQKNGKAAGLKQRLAAIKDKRTKKQETQEIDSTEKKSKKDKAQKAAGVILFPVILILGIPILIGKGIASGFKKVKDHKKKTDDDGEGTEEQQQPPPHQEAKSGRRTAMKHRLSERSGSVKQGLSTRREAIKKRLAERKAKKTDANEETAAAASSGGQPVTAGQDSAGDGTTQTHLTKKQRLTSLLAAGPLALNHMIKQRRQGGHKPKTTTSADAPPTEKKASRFSGIKARVKGLRTKVNKQARFAKLKARLRTIQERRQNKRNVKKNASDNDTAQASEGEDSNNTKKHSALAGLAAACVALPAAKMKQVRDKRRKEKAAESVEGAAAAAREEQVAANSPLPAATDPATGAEGLDSASPVSRPSGARLVPPEPEMFEPAADQFRPPENGQSEVPVQQAARTEPDLPLESRVGDDSTAADGAAPVGDDRRAKPAAAVSFKSIRDGFDNVKGGIGGGITNLKARRRGTGQDEAPAADGAQRPPAETMDSAETQVEASPPTAEPVPQATPTQQDGSVSGGKFKSIKGGIGSGIEGLKTKRQREKAVPAKGEEPATTAATEDERRTAGANKDASSPGAKLKAVKDGIAGRRAKTDENGADGPVKTEKSKQHRQQTHKEPNSGMVDRMKWFLYAA
jgi:hypothetical protein